MAPRDARVVMERGIFWFQRGLMEGNMTDQDRYVHGFIKLARSDDLIALLKRRSSAYCLLTLIALRARRTNYRIFDELNVGEALIGDEKSYGASKRTYRTDKQFLKKNGLATFRSTNKGTIARIVDTSIFDINPENLTSKEAPIGHTIDIHKTTNKNDKNDKKNTDALKKIELVLGDKFTYKAGRPYHLGKGNTWELIFSPQAFADKLPDAIRIPHNPILEDPDFQKYQAIKDQDSDGVIRRKMMLETVLGNRYPRERYDRQWREAEGR